MLLVEVIDSLEILKWQILIESATGVEDPDGCILPAAKLYLFTKMTQCSIIYISNNLMSLCR